MHFCTVTALGLVHLLSQPKLMGPAVKTRGEGDLSARLYPDAYLAALAISNGWRLVSFDRDFERFGGLQRLSLSSGG